MQKKDWVQHIENRLAQRVPFVYSTSEDNKAPLLFAVDLFRRRRHDVTVSLEPSLARKVVVHICISPDMSALEFTVRRNQNADDIIKEMESTNVKVVTIRGCGTVINKVCSVVETAIHSGWYVEKNILNTLTQTGTDNVKQRNTTLLVVLRRGSNLGSI